MDILKDEFEIRLILFLENIFLPRFIQKIILLFIQYANGSSNATRPAL